MIKRIALLIGGLILLLALSSIWYQRAHAPQGQSLPTEFVTLQSPDGEVVRVEVEVADDEEEHRVGLMYRTSLPEGKGMVFVFNEPQDRSFWMKNTLIPLDILYFDGEGMFVSRTTMSPCTTVECPSYPSLGPARFALEVNAAEPLTAGVAEGWKLIR